MPIPFNDIKIDPKKLKKKIINKIDNININNIIKKLVIKEINDILDANHFWYEITGKNICAYRYQYSKKKEEFICGKPIYRNNNIEYGTFLCSRHHKDHVVEKKRKLKENDIQCKAITINNTQCLYASKLDGYCNQHYKCINKLDIKEIHKLIENEKIAKNEEILENFEKLNNIESNDISNLEDITSEDKSIENEKNIEILNIKENLNKNICTTKRKYIEKSNKKFKINIFKNKKLNKKVLLNNINNNRLDKINKEIHKKYLNLILDDIYYSDTPISLITNNYKTSSFPC